MNGFSSTVAPRDRETIRRDLLRMSAAWRTIIDGWRDAGTRHTEKSHAQQFWSDMLRCFGVIPERIALFEQDALRASSGRQGYMDLFWSGVVLGEAKSLGKSLDEAAEQIHDYLAGGSIGQHEWPRYTVVTDFENLRVTTLDPTTAGTEDTVAFTIDEIADHVDQLMFLAGQETVTKAEEEEASIQASRLMADLYTAMTKTDDVVARDGAEHLLPAGEDLRTHQTSVFLTRVLFLLYGDDAGLWEADLFYRFVLRDTTTGNLGGQLFQLFQVLNTPESARRNVPDAMARFPYVNGGLFADVFPAEFFTDEMREALLAACRFRWTRISPAVFGSMFQLVKSKKARRAAGEHYTTEANILKVIEPLFLDDLRAEADRLIRNRSTSAAQLRRFRDSLAEMVFLDPACGCGNFLVVAYRELRAIETRVIVALRAKEGQQTASMDVTLDQRLSIDQFHGFEVNWWPAKIAETAMFLVDHQANRELAAAVGDAPERLPITVTAHITHANALRLDWSETVPRTTGMTYVFGNPPFKGQYTKSSDQAADMKHVWGADYAGYLDYVTGWHVKTMRFLADRAGEFAFVTTNSITQGQPVPALFGPLYREGWDISFAHRTFTWDSEAPGQAAVHCVIIGFTREEVATRRLWDYPDPAGPAVEVPVGTTINAYLLDLPRILVAKRMKPLSPHITAAVRGSQPTDDGNLIVEVDEYAEVASDPVARKYLRPLTGSHEVVNGLDRWCLWLEDAEPREIQSSPVLRRRVEAVAEFRRKSRKSATRAAASTPSLFQERRLAEGDYLCIPRVVSGQRPFLTAAQLSGDVVTSDSAFTVNDPSGLCFALVSSSMFITWQQMIGGRLKSDVRFANTLTWNTFPVPPLTDAAQQAIIVAGRGVLDARAKHPDRSLAEAYNPLAMDPALLKAHGALDRVVDKAFGASRKLTTERQRQELLIARYLELTGDNAPVS